MLKLKTLKYKTQDTTLYMLQRYNIFYVIKYF